MLNRLQLCRSGRELHWLSPTIHVKKKRLENHTSLHCIHWQYVTFHKCLQVTSGRADLTGNYKKCDVNTAHHPNLIHLSKWSIGCVIRMRAWRLTRASVSASLAVVSRVALAESMLSWKETIWSYSCSNLAFFSSSMLMDMLLYCSITRAIISSFCVCITASVSTQWSWSRHQTCHSEERYHSSQTWMLITQTQLVLPPQSCRPAQVQTPGPQCFPTFPGARRSSRSASPDKDTLTGKTFISESLPPPDASYSLLELFKSPAGTLLENSTF